MICLSFRNCYLPNECWADTLKLFSRRHLVHRVQPVTRRLYGICELHVRTRHVFKKKRNGKIGIVGLLSTLARKLPQDQSQCASLVRHYVIGPSYTAGQYANTIFNFCQKDGTEEEQDNYQVERFFSISFCKHILFFSSRSCFFQIKRRKRVLDVLLNSPDLFQNSHLQLNFLDKSQVSE